MQPKNIRDNPSLEKLAKDARNIQLFQKGWKYLKPLAKLIGINISGIDESLNKMNENIAEAEEFVNLPDKFNDLFSDYGWICFDSLNVNVMKEAITKAELEGIEQAEIFLVDHFSPDWVRSRLLWLKHIKGFKLRYSLIEKACEDYENKRYYSSVLVVLTQIDGIVNDLNICDHQRLGFFSKDSKVIAWDSIAAHEKGLVKLQEVFGKKRCMTRQETISIPYRHGIIHGMDLGYDNRTVAAKSWATIFALRDWVIKVTKNELIPPEEKPENEKTLMESIEDYINLQNQIEKQKQWTPREINIDQIIPKKGKVSEYQEDTPERKLIEFLTYWEKDNYGFMSKFFPPDFQMRPVDIRNKFSEFDLNDFELIKISDVIPTVSDVFVKLSIIKDDILSSSPWNFRFVRYTEEGKMANIILDKTTWYIVRWENR